MVARALLVDQADDGGAERLDRARPTIALAFAHPLAGCARRWRRREFCVAPEVLAVAAAGTIASAMVEISARMPIARRDN